MTGCHNCGALSGLDPHGTCNACGKPCDYSVALQQLTAESRARENAEAALLEMAGVLEEIRAHWKKSLDDRERVINMGMAQAGQLKAATAARNEAMLDAQAAHRECSAAEAQLAAVNDVAQRAERRVQLYPGLKGSTYYAAYLEILALLVNAGSPTPVPQHETRDGGTGETK